MGYMTSLSRHRHQGTDSGDQQDETSPSPSDLSQDFANAPDEPVPWFEKHRYAAGFLAGLAGGQEGIRTLLSVREAYRRHRDLAAAAQERRTMARDRLAFQTMTPEVAGTVEAADALRQRLMQPAPEGYETNPLNPRHPLKKPVAPKAERPVSVAPGHSLVEPGTGRVIMTVPKEPKPPKEPDTAKEDAAAAKDAQRRMDAMRNRNYRLKQDEASVRRQIARAREEGRIDEIDPLRKQLKMILDEQKAVTRQPGGLAASMGPAYQPPPGAMPYTNPPPAVSRETPPAAMGSTGIPGYSQDEIDELRKAMDEDDRDEFDSYTPEKKKQVLDAAYGRSGK